MYKYVITSENKNNDFMYLIDLDGLVLYIFTFAENQTIKITIRITRLKRDWDNV